MKVDEKTGKFPYKNIVDALVKTTRREGVGKLWIGFPNFYARCGGHIVIHLMILSSI